MSESAVQHSDAKTGFRPLRVAGKHAENRLITSFRLEPLDGGTLPEFRPGQFLVFRLPAGTGGEPIFRNYSLSGSPRDSSSYRITVKREASPGSGIPAGLGSNWLHDEVQTGDVLEVDGPRGDFVLDGVSKRPVVLLSGGVGLTPMMAMLHDLASGSDRRVFFLHACENGDHHALRQEQDALVAMRSGLTAKYFYRAPTNADRAEGRFHCEGFITRDALQSLLCIDDYEFYLCGPPPFMQAMYKTLRSLGVDAARIAYEFFGPATVLDADEKPKTRQPTEAPTADVTVAAGAVLVEFRRSGITAKWNPAAGSLLSFAEDQGLAPEFSCRAGVCGTCRSSLLSGEVNYFEEPLDELKPGELLLCCARPKTSLVLDL